MPFVAIGVVATTLVTLLAFWALSLLVADELPRWLDWTKTAGLSAVEYYDVARAAVTFGASVAVGATLVLAYRRQATTEAGLALDRRKELQRISELGQSRASEVVADFRARFSASAEQLGSSSAASRLAGVYSMSALTDEWNDPAQTQICIDVFCAYLRTPEVDAADRVVRRAVVKVTRSHLIHDSAHSWSGHDFDFSGANFFEADFASSNFGGAEVSFRDCVFHSEQRSTDFSGMSSTTFTKVVDFSGATFTGSRADFGAVSIGSGCTLQFDDAQFRCTELSFDGASIRGELRLAGAQIESATTFSSALLEGAFIIDLERATIRGGSLDFSEASDESNILALRVRGLSYPDGAVNWGQFSEAVRDDIPQSGEG